MSKKKIEYVLEPVDDIGNLIPLRKFISMCKQNMFIDYDGMGDLATKTTRVASGFGNWIKPSEVVKWPEDLIQRIEQTFTHVCWYNR